MRVVISNYFKALSLFTVIILGVFAATSQAQIPQAPKLWSARGQDGRKYLCTLKSSRLLVGVRVGSRFVLISQLIRRSAANATQTKLWKRRLKIALAACQNASTPPGESTPDNSNDPKKPDLPGDIVPTPSVTPTMTATPTITASPTITPTATQTYAQHLEPSWPEFHGSTVTIPFGVDYRLPTSQEFAETQAAINALNNPARPRIHANAARLAAIRATLLAHSDDILDDYYRRILLHTQYNLITSNWSIPSCNTANANEMLTWARDRFWNLEYLTLVYRLDVNITPQFRAQVLARAKAELASAADCGSYFQDNSTAHVAATAMRAMALGYDWLFDQLSLQERTQLEYALKVKGLDQYRLRFEDGCPNPWGACAGTKRFWQYSGGNMLGVSASGAGYAALALLGSYDVDVSELLTYSRITITNGLARAFAPDGGFSEGPDYLRYVLDFVLGLKTSLDNVFGQDFGIAQIPGLSASYRYLLASGGLGSEQLNFADATSQLHATPELFLLAALNSNPTIASYNEILGIDHSAQGYWERQEPRALLYRSLPGAGLLSSLPSVSWFKSIHEYYASSDISDPDALTIAISGGSNKWVHAEHLDQLAIGLRYKRQSFGKIAGYGQIGTDEYSTLSFDGRQQSDTDKSALAIVSDKPGDPFAVLRSYTGYSAVQSHLRGVRLLDNNRALVQDDVTALAGTRVKWQFITDAQVQLGSDWAMLTKNGVSLKLRVLAPTISTIGSSSVAIEGNSSATMISFEVISSSSPLRFAVVLQGGTKLNDSEAIELTPLTEWRN